MLVFWRVFPKKKHDSNSSMSMWFYVDVCWQWGIPWYTLTYLKMAIEDHYRPGAQDLEDVANGILLNKQQHVWSVESQLVT